jgi:hypothetical protein
MTGMPMETDFTSFESSFRKIIMEALDFRLFNYFVKKLSNKLYKKLYERLASKNHCQFKFFKLFINARRMSGEMCTSLCNSFANKMILEFVCEHFGYEIPKDVVDGDDALAMNAAGKYPSASDFAELGFKIKLEVRDSVSTASFCGLIYDEVDLINVTDPREVLLEFGWATARYAKARKSRLMSLLRCKALSYLHQYPGAPIIQDVALYGLLVTRNYDAKSFAKNDRSLNQYDRERYLSTEFKYSDIIREIPINTRMLVERKFNITFEEQQIIEKKLKQMTFLQSFDFEIIYKEEHYAYFNNYVRPLGLPPMVMSQGLEFIKHIVSGTNPVCVLLSDTEKTTVTLEELACS